MFDSAIQKSDLLTERLVRLVEMSIECCLNTGFMDGLGVLQVTVRAGLTLKVALSTLPATMQDLRFLQNGSNIDPREVLVWCLEGGTTLSLNASAIINASLASCPSFKSMRGARLAPNTIEKVRSRARLGNMVY